MSANSVHESADDGHEDDQDGDAGLTRRELKRKARREEMLDAAMSIVVNEGVNSLTIARLARELDAAVGALYRYFDSKQALIMALQRRAIEGFGEDLLKDLAAANAFLDAAGCNTRDDPTTTLFRVLVVYVAYLNDAHRAPARHNLMRMMMSQPTALLSDEEALKVEESVSPVIDSMNRLMEEAERSGALAPGDPSSRTYLAWAALHGLDYFRRRDRIVTQESIKFRSLSLAMIRTLLLGWGAPEQPLEDAFTLLRFNTRTSVV